MDYDDNRVCTVWLPDDWSQWCFHICVKFSHNFIYSTYQRTRHWQTFIFNNIAHHIIEIFKLDVWLSLYRMQKPIFVGTLKHSNEISSQVLIELIAPLKSSMIILSKFRLFHRALPERRKKKKIMKKIKTVRNYDEDKISNPIQCQSNHLATS